MTKRVTIADVAREAGVSMMTVSRAINDKGEISPATRQRILAIAKEMDYRPSGLARGLATQRTATVGLVVPDIANPFFSQIARGVEDIAYAHGYNVFLLNSVEDVDRERAALDSLWEKQVDGLLLCSSRLDQKTLVERLQQFRYVVLVNRLLQTAVDGVCTINVDDTAGARQAVDYLLNAGHETIAFLAGPRQSLSSQQRLSGYQQSLQAYGRPLRQELILHCEPDTEGGYNAALSLLTAHPDVTAVYAFNDLIATGTLKACQELGRRVPQDLAIIGSDDIPLASLVTPSLTTLRITKRHLGTTAMQTLLHLIQQSEPPPAADQTLHPQLILRNSTLHHPH